MHSHFISIYSLFYIPLTKHRREIQTSQNKAILEPSLQYHLDILSKLIFVQIADFQLPREDMRLECPVGKTQSPSAHVAWAAPQQGAGSLGSWLAWEPGSFLKAGLRPWSFIHTLSSPSHLEGKARHTFVGWQNQMDVSLVLYLCPRIQEAQKYWLTTLLPSQCNSPLNMIQSQELHSRWAKLQGNCLISFSLQWKNYIVTGMTRFPFNNKHL